MERVDGNPGDGALPGECAGFSPEAVAVVGQLGLPERALAAWVGVRALRGPRPGVLTVPRAA